MGLSRLSMAPGIGMLASISGSGRRVDPAVAALGHRVLADRPPRLALDVLDLLDVLFVLEGPRLTGGQSPVAHLRVEVAVEGVGHRVEVVVGVVDLVGKALLHIGLVDAPFSRDGVR